MGGSLGMALRGRGLAQEVVGLGRSQERLESARELGALDSFTTQPREALRGADALISCLPCRDIRQKWRGLASLIQPGAFVTDVGSVKRSIVKEAESALDKSVLFVGSHPMAGSEKSGVGASRENLFDGACCFVTPTDRTPREALGVAAQFWQALGSRIVIMDPERHDALLASISHLPHLFAAALVQTLYTSGDSATLLRSIMGKGFLDSTRIAEGEPRVWEQIFRENSSALGHELERLIEILQQWRAMISASDSGEEIIERLTETSLQRKQLSDKTDAHDQS